MAPRLLRHAVLVLIMLWALPEGGEGSRPGHDGVMTLLLPARPGGPPSIHVDIADPADRALRGDLLVLPGWNFSRREWQAKSPLLAEAAARGLRCVFPEMKVTLYESRYYPETTMKWATLPGGQWIKTVLLPELQKKGIFTPEGDNYVLGLSTGGRGAVLLCLQNPGVFKAAAALSGDFNQTAMPADRLMKALYGPYESFSRRWHDDDNPFSQVLLWNTPLYLGHGQADDVVPFSQSETWYRALKKNHPRLRLIFNKPEKAGHDFHYWSSEVGPVLDFFISIERVPSFPRSRPDPEKAIP